MAHSDPYQLAIDRWHQRAIPLLPPARDDEIERTFAKLKYPVSGDVRRLYSTAAGFEDYECDDLWSLWSLRRILEENTNRDSPFLWFADYFSCCHMYGFHYRSPEVSAVYIDHNSDKHPPYEIADSVEQFLLKYLANPDNVEAFVSDDG